MFKIIQSWQNKKNIRKNLLGFLSEIEKNLEIYYVMDQRQFITSCYLMDKWQQVKDFDILKVHPEIKLYVDCLVDFNKAYEEYKVYEQWYSSDMKNKNNENAKKLHALKDSLQVKIKTFEGIIIAAGQALERELLNLGFIDN